MFTDTRIIIYGIIGGAISSFFAGAVSALTLKEEISSRLTNAAVTQAKYAENPLALLVGDVISIILTIVGLIFLVLIVYGGMKWMMAQGDESKVTEARNFIIHSLIGLIIVTAAYAIAYFIIQQLQTATT